MEKGERLTDEEANEAWRHFEQLVRAIVATPKEVVQRRMAEAKAERKTAMGAKRKAKH